MWRLAASALLLCWLAVREQDVPPLRWFRGTTHVHTALSDGDASPLVVARWYRDHGYDFVALTDHDALTPVDRLNKTLGDGGRFLVVPGVEVTDRLVRKPVHVNGIGVREVVKPAGGASVVEILDRNADAVVAAGGVPHANHPSFGWAFGAEELAASRVRHFELFNGHPGVNGAGGGGTASTEEMWDAVLSRGRTLFAVATDDAHDFHGEFSAAMANPGRGFVAVRAHELTRDAIVGALAAGDFYASNGAEIEELVADATGLRLRLPQRPTWRVHPERPLDVRYRTYFIGCGGKVLRRDDTFTPSYTLQPDDVYVRARVEASNGMQAWTQPVRSAARSVCPVPEERAGARE